MPTAASEDTEITLGTGKMLALFFGLVALCAVFFGMGFSFGKNSALRLSAADTSAPVTTASASLRSSVVKPNTATSPDTPTKPDSNQPAPNENAANSAVGTSSPGTAPASPDPTIQPVLNGYYVQVAAVSKQEDGDALVDALKKKQYPAFSAASPTDKLFHVQVGPYAEVKDAEAMRTKLISDGYNPILKK